MATTKLTLSADQATVRAAKKLARERKTSVSALFAHLVNGMAEPQRGTPAIGPLTRRASGLVDIPARRAERRLLEEELARKYGIER